MTTTTLTNSFHRTSVRIRVSDDLEGATQREVYEALESEAKSYYPLTRRAFLARKRLNRVRRTLCGVSGCCCGVVR